MSTDWNLELVPRYRVMLALASGDGDAIIEACRAAAPDHVNESVEDTFALAYLAGICAERVTHPTSYDAAMTQARAWELDQAFDKLDRLMARGKYLGRPRPEQPDECDHSQGSYGEHPNGFRFCLLCDGVLE